MMFVKRSSKLIGCSGSQMPLRSFQSLLVPLRWFCAAFKAQADMSWLLASILLLEPRPWTRIKPDSVLNIFKRCPKENLWVLLDKTILGARNLVN